MPSPNSRLPWLVVVIVSILAVGALVWQSRTSSPAPAATLATMPDNNGAVDDRPLPPSDAAQASGGSRLQAGPMRSPHAARQAQRKALIERGNAIYEATMRQFNAEKVDPAWAAQAEGQLQQATEDPAFDQAGIKPLDIGIDCRSTMCSVNSRLDSDGLARDWTQLYMGAAGKHISLARAQFIRNPDGTTTARIYTHK